jgi:hypothetical protein
MIVGDGATRVAFRSVSGDLRILDGSHRAAAPPSPMAAVSVPESGADHERMTILRAIERGELDVPTAMARLGELDEDEDA